MFLELVLTVLASLRGSDAYIFFFALLFTCGVGAPWAADVLLVAAAGFSLQGAMQPGPLMVVAWMAIVLGDALTFWTGHHYGARWVRRPWAQGFVPPQRLPGLEAGMRRWGPALGFVTRFLPGQRTSLFFLFGTLRMRYRTFFLADGVAALVYVPALVLGARSLGWTWQRWQDPVDSVDNWLTLALVIVLVGWWLRVRKAARN